jgi:hypothetical protein
VGSENKLKKVTPNKKGVVAKKEEAVALSKWHSRPSVGRATAKAVVAKTLPQEAAAVVEEQEQEHMQFLKPWQR